MRIPSCFSLKGSRASAQKMRGAISPHAHHCVSEPSRDWLQFEDERPGRANSKPTMLHRTAAAIHRPQRCLIRIRQMLFVLFTSISKDCPFLFEPRTTSTTKLPVRFLDFTSFGSILFSVKN